MLTKILIGIFAYYAFILVLSVFLKRNFKIAYDRKTLLSGLLLVITGLCVWLLPNIASEPDFSISFESKIAWLFLISMGTNALIQCLFWLFYTFIRHNGLVKMPRFIFNIIGIVILVGVVLYTLKYLFDVNLSGLLVTSTVLSAIIGLSLQDTLTNLFAGVSLQIESPFNIDEWVSLGGHEGKVVSQNWRSLTLITRENHRITLPNKAVAEEKIINYSRPTPRQIHSFHVELDYSHPPNKVKKILSDLLIDIKGVDIDHIAYPYVVAYADSGITYCLKFWINDYGEMPFIQDTVLSRLWYSLERNRIKIPYTISEVKMELKTEELITSRELERMQYLQLKLRQQKWLSEMEEEQLKVLSESASIKQYSIDENLVNQGVEGDSMFIIIRGSARVLVLGNQGREVHVADKNKGDFFGEMSLLTGDPRTATVRAKEDMEVIVIDKEAFTEILLKDSKILELLVSALESNQSSLTTIIEEERQNSNTTNHSAREVIMNKIKDYLSLGS